MEFVLPEQAYVHKFIPKTKFFTKTVVNTKLKKEFSDKIQRITWAYKIAEETIGVPPTDIVEEIQIFEIQLKEKTIPKNILKIIDKTIPYPILYVFQYGENIAFGITLKGDAKQHYYFSDWGEEMNFDFSGLDLEKVYQGIVKMFIHNDVGKSEDFATILAVDKKRQNLEREIKVLENKIRTERQFNKKVTLNTLLHKKQTELSHL